MKKRFLSIVLCLSLVLALLPTAALADSSKAPTEVYICGMTLTDGKCLTNNEAASVSNYTDGASYVALYKGGVLYLNGLNKTYAGTTDSRVINWNYSSSGAHDLVIELVAGSVNTLVDTNYGAINGASGFSGAGPSLTIQGKGTLNVTGGTYGIWVWEDVVIQNGATVNIVGNGTTGATHAGVCTNDSGHGLTIKQGTTVTISGAKYGVSADNSATGLFTVLGGNLVIKGETAALNKLASDFSGNTVYVSDNVSGEGAAEWNGTTALTSYKYISLSGFSSTVTTYDVTKAVAENGSFSVDYEKSMAGETITITATPASGYEVDTVTVTDADSGSVTVSGTGNTRTFTMPEKNVTVAVTFKAIASTTYTVAFAGGVGATGTAPTQADTAAGGTFTLPANTFTKDGHTFAGWNDGTTTYQAGNTYTMPASNVTFTAQWTENTPVTPTPVTLGNNGYPYGKDMKTDSVTLVTEVTSGTATEVQWYSGTTKDGEYAAISGATELTYTFAPSFDASAQANWFKCKVNGTFTEAVQVVQAVNSYDKNDDADLKAYQVRVAKGLNSQWYVSNGDVAYAVFEKPDSFGISTKVFDVIGKYTDTDGDTYWLNTSYKPYWEAYTGYDTMYVSFDGAKVVFAVKLGSEQTEFCIGTDVELGESNMFTDYTYSDSASLKAVYDGDDVLQQIQMVGAESIAKARDTDPAFVLAFATAPSAYWLGYYNSRTAYGYNTNTEADTVKATHTVDIGGTGTKVVSEVAGTDSGMTASWKVAAGGVVEFSFAVGSVAGTGAITSNTTTDSVTVKNSRTDTYYALFAADGTTMVRDWTVGNGGNLVFDNTGLTSGQTEIVHSTNYVVKAVSASEFDTGSNEPNSTANITSTTVTTLTPPAPTTYTVTFNTNGHGTAPTAQSVTVGATATAPTAPTTTGYTFGGWYTDVACTEGYDFTTAVTADITLYAKWTINVYAVTFDANGLGTAPAAQNVNYGSNATEPAALYSSGYTFGGWYTDPECTAAYDFSTPVTGNLTLYAKWTYNPVYIHSCDSKCAICGGCTDLACPASVCAVKCILPGMNFVDVAEGTWYTDAVSYVYHHGMMTGIGSNVFGISDTTNRAMIWTVLGRISGADVDGGTPWYAKAQAWSVTAGVSDGTDPNGAITREQLVTMLYRYAGSPVVTEADKALLDGYTDTEKVSSWAVDAMAWAVSKGIINGVDGALVPQGHAIRSQVAAIMMRFCEYAEVLEEGDSEA